MLYGGLTNIKIFDPEVTISLSFRVRGGLGQAEPGPAQSLGMAVRRQKAAVRQKCTSADAAGIALGGAAGPIHSTYIGL